MSQSVSAVTSTQNRTTLNHRAAVSYGANSSAFYIEHVGQLRVEAPEEPTRSNWSWFMYPYKDNFQARTAPWSALENAFANEASRIITLSGSGGMGKTTIASQWAHEQNMQENRRYTTIRFMNMEGSSNQRASLENWADTLKLPYKEKTILELWAAIANSIKEESWLLIFDNVENYHSISDGLNYLTANARQKWQHILITSRDEISWKDSIKIDSYTLQEAEAYIKQQIVSVNDLTCNDQEVTQLSTRLSCYPLALELAMGKICSEPMSISQYLNELAEQGLLTEENIDNQNQMRINTSTLTQLWQSISQKLTDEAKELVYFFSFSDAEGCSKLLLEKVYENCLKYRFYNTKNKTLLQILNILRNQSLVKKNPGKDDSHTFYHMHRLLQEIIRNEVLAIHFRDSGFWERCISAVLHIFPEEIRTKDEVTMSIRALAHAEAWLQNTNLLFQKGADGSDGKFSPNDKLGLQFSQMLLHLNSGRAEYNLGRYNLAETVINKGLIVHKIYGDNMARGLRCYFSIYTGQNYVKALANLHYTIGDIYRALGDPNRSVAAYKEALEVYYSLYQKIEEKARWQRKTENDISTPIINTQEIAAVLNNMGRAYIECGSFYDGFRSLRHALSMKQTIYSDNTDNRHIVGTLNSIGEMEYRANNNFELAKETVLKAKTMYERIHLNNTNEYPNKDPLFAAILNNLGNIYARQHSPDYSQAIKYYQDALNIYYSVYDETKKHPAIADVLNNLGLVYCELGENLDAIASHEKALVIYETFYSHHQKIINTRQYLSSARQVENSKIEISVDDEKKSVWRDVPSPR